MQIQERDLDRLSVAFEELRPRFDQQKKLRRANVDIEKAAAQALVIGRMVQRPEVREMFEQLSSRVFDMGHVNDLEKAALATLHAVIAYRNAAVFATQARVPPGVVAEARELKQRMLLVLGYYLREDHEVAVLADIQGGKSHAKLASDLLRLSDRYSCNEARLRQDRVHYRPEDAARASELSRRIYACLGGHDRSEERVWAGHVQRAWTFLLATYDEVRVAGRFVYRHEKGRERFPSLISSQRQTARRSGKRGSEADDSTPPDAGDI